MEILKIGDEIGDVVIRGSVQSVDMREIRNERTIFMFTITDFTDTIGVKIFVQNAEVPELKDAIKKGAFIKVKGKTTVDAFDHDLTVMSVWGIKKITDFRTGRQDTSPVKRVELHCHTKMSDMDGVTDAARLVQRACEWGHPAIAITDHNEVSGALEARDRANGIKVIVAEEVKTADQGEVIGLFLEELIPRGMTLEETVAAIKAQGGLVYVPHPFDRLHSVPDYEHLLAVVDQVDAIEIFNPRIAIAAWNAEAVRFAGKYRIPGGAGSDAGSPSGRPSAAAMSRCSRSPTRVLPWSATGWSPRAWPSWMRPPRPRSPGSSRAWTRPAPSPAA